MNRLTLSLFSVLLVCPVLFYVGKKRCWLLVWGRKLVEHDDHCRDRLWYEIPIQKVDVVSAAVVVSGEHCSCRACCWVEIVVALVGGGSLAFLLRHHNNVSCIILEMSGILVMAWIAYFIPILV